MKLVQKYKSNTLTVKEKKLFLKICLELEVEDFFNWLDELKITKKVKTSLECIGGVSGNNSINFTRILRGSYAPIGWVYNIDFEPLFGKCDDNKTIDTIDYFKFLQNMGITPSKIDDLLVSLSFNVTNDTFDNINEENILSKYKEISIIKSPDDFYIAE